MFKFSILMYVNESRLRLRPVKFSILPTRRRIQVNYGKILGWWVVNENLGGGLRLLSSLSLLSVFVSVVSVAPVFPVFVAGVVVSLITGAIVVVITADSIVVGTGITVVRAAVLLF